MLTVAEPTLEHSRIRKIRKMSIINPERCSCGKSETCTYVSGMVKAKMPNERSDSLPIPLKVPATRETKVDCENVFPLC